METIIVDDSLRFKQDKDSSLEFRKRKHDDWRGNYTHYRDRVITNRLTQRQTINIPLMRYGINTVLKDIDEPPMIFFKSKDNNSQKELYYNAYWDETARINKLPVRDRADKKQAMLYGRTFKGLNIIDGIFRFTVEATDEMLVDRYVDPIDIDSTRSLIRTGIFKTLNWILNNPKYNSEGKSMLKSYFDKNSSIQESERNTELAYARQAKLSDIGITDAFNPIVGETTIELNDSIRLEHVEGEDQFMFYTFAITGEDVITLYKDKLENVIGKTRDNYWKTHLPYTSWGMDIERGDFWSDGPADSLRQLCDTLDSWASGLVENRTLKNLNMHYYNALTPAGGTPFVPQTFTPEAWGWYGVPGNPEELIKDVAVPDLSDSLEEIQFLIGIGEKAIAASGTQTGEVAQRQVTLGEIQIAVANAKDRTKSAQVYYQNDWESFGEKYVKMLEAKGGDMQTFEVSKRGRTSNKIYLKEISPVMNESRKGWEVEVTVKEDRMNEQADELQKLNVAKANMPDNTPLDRIYKKKLIDFANLSTEEQKEVMDFEDQKINVNINPMGNPMGAQPVTPPVAPVAPTINQ